jgi:flagella basal body P-ring formation protein FlgA
MNLLALFALGLVCAGGGDDKDKPRHELRLKPNATVRGVEVQIGEICDVAPLDAEGLAIAQLRFGPAPGQGNVRVVGRAELVQSLAAAGRDLAKVKIDGATEAVVQSVWVEVSVQELLDSATAALQAVLAVEGGDVEVEAPNQIRRVQAPPGRVGQELVARLRGERTGPLAAVVDVDVVVDGQSWRKIPVQFRLIRYQQVLKTTAAVRAGVPLGPENVVVAREAVAQGQAPFLTRIEDAAGLVAARNLSGNQRLTLGDTALPALVRRGDLVTVVMTVGRVKVTARALANEDAPLGGRITLTNAQSRAQIVGVVTAPGLVVVQQ